MAMKSTEIALKITIRHDDDVDAEQALREYLIGFREWTPGVTQATARVAAVRTKDMTSGDLFEDILRSVFNT